MSTGSISLDILLNKILTDSLLDELEMRWEDEQKLNGLSSVHSMGFRQFIFSIIEISLLRL